MCVCVAYEHVRTEEQGIKKQKKILTNWLSGSVDIFAAARMGPIAPDE